MRFVGGASLGRALSCGALLMPRACCAWLRRRQLPFLGSTMQLFAEAFGCRAALLWNANRGGNERTVRIAGDNLAVARYCAHVSQLRRPNIQSLLEEPLGDVYARGWSVEWVAARRHLNRAADVLATAGVFWAARLAEQNSMSIKVCWESGLQAD